jgi:hypothetical protein
MPRTQFTAFYPSRPFWAVSKVNFNVPRVEGWFHDQMVEEVFTADDERVALRICRDGRVLVRVARLEKSLELADVTPIADTVRRWGEYLDFLNAFYLLLDSATIEVDHLCYFNLHEVTNRDAFRVTYEDGKSTGENIAIESIASVFQMGRYSGSYSPNVPIEYDSRILMRHAVSRDALAHASNLFLQVVARPGTEKQLASFAKSLAEYKVGNYETSIVLAWFITEAAINSLWGSHLDAQNSNLEGGRRRINRERKDFLTGRDLSTSIVSNMLELAGVLDHALFEEVDAVRGYRNKIVHSHRFVPSASEAQLAMKTAQAMIERQWGIRFTPNTGYSVSGL